MLSNILKLCKVKGNQKISKELKFEVSNSKNKKSGQQSGFQKVWKILLSLKMGKNVGSLALLNESNKKVCKLSY
jgi:hypothetical protein